MMILKKIILILITAILLVAIPISFYKQIFDYFGFKKTLSIESPSGWTLDKKYPSSQTKLYVKKDTRELMNFHLCENEVSHYFDVQTKTEKLKIAGHYVTKYINIMSDKSNNESDDSNNKEKRIQSMYIRCLHKQ